MKAAHILLTIALAVLASGALSEEIPPTAPPAPLNIPAQYTSHFFFAPSVRYTFGETEYVMDIRQIDGELGVLKLKSQLEFPLDGVLAGGTVGLHIARNNRPLWRFELGLWTNANNPGGTMYDHDWANFYTGTYEKFSYTESDVEMNSLLIDLRGAYAIHSRPTWDLSLTGGYRYQHIYQDVIGFAGWQLDPETFERNYFDFENLLGITYEINYHLPNVGLMLNADLGQRATLAVHGAGALAIASDEDDHVLRKKISTADMTGWGLLSGASLDYAPGGSAAPGFFISLSGGLDYFSASGDQTQYWYEDETIDVYNPETEQWEEEVVVEAGTRLTGIPHDITSLQFHTGLKVGFRF